MGLFFVLSFPKGTKTVRKEGRSMKCVATKRIIIFSCDLTGVERNPASLLGRCGTGRPSERTHVMSPAALPFKSSCSNCSCSSWGTTANGTPILCLGKQQPLQTGGCAPLGALAEPGLPEAPVPGGHWSLQAGRQGPAHQDCQSFLHGRLLLATNWVRHRYIMAGEFPPELQGRLVVKGAPCSESLREGVRRTH